MAGPAARHGTARGGPRHRRRAGRASARRRGEPAAPRVGAGRGIARRRRSSPAPRSRHGGRSSSVDGRHRRLPGGRPHPPPRRLGSERGPRPAGRRAAAPSVRVPLPVRGDPAAPWRLRPADPIRAVGAAGDRGGGRGRDRCRVGPSRGSPALPCRCGDRTPPGRSVPGARARLPALGAGLGRDPPAGPPDRGGATGSTVPGCAARRHPRGPGRGAAAPRRCVRRRTGGDGPREPPRRAGRRAARRVGHDGGGVGGRDRRRRGGGPAPSHHRARHLATRRRAHPDPAPAGFARPAGRSRGGGGHERRPGRTRSRSGRRPAHRGARRGAHRGSGGPRATRRHRRRGVGVARRWRRRRRRRRLGADDRRPRGAPSGRCRLHRRAGSRVVERCGSRRGPGSRRPVPAAAHLGAGGGPGWPDARGGVTLAGRRAQRHGALGRSRPEARGSRWSGDRGRRVGAARRGVTFGPCTSASGPIVSTSPIGPSSWAS